MFICRMASTTATKTSRNGVRKPRVTFTSLQHAEKRVSPQAVTMNNISDFTARAGHKSFTFASPLFLVRVFEPSSTGNSTSAGVASSPWPAVTSIAPTGETGEKRKRPELSVRLTIVTGKKRTSNLASLRTQLRKRFRNAARDCVTRDNSLVLPKWSYLVLPNKELLRADKQLLIDNVHKAFLTLRSKASTTTTASDNVIGRMNPSRSSLPRKVSQTASSKQKRQKGNPTKRTQPRSQSQQARYAAPALSQTRQLTTCTPLRGQDHQQQQEQDSSTSKQQSPNAHTAAPRKAPEIRPSADPRSRSNDPAHAQTLQKLLRYPTLFDPIRKPRHPLVLAHGLFGFDTFGLPYLPRFQYAYWHEVLKVLKDIIGAEVIVTNVPGAGAVKTRAESLHAYLNENANMRAVNILAHSMGGLDARWLLTQIRPTNYTPLSLTTLSTPHRGSDFMSWCGANIGVGAEHLLAKDAQARKPWSKLPYSLSNPILSAASSLAGSASGSDQKGSASMIAGLGPAFSKYLLKLLDSPAYSNLTPDFLEDFNQQTPDRDDIRYYSVSARVTRIGVWHPLWLPKLILDAADESRAQEVGGRRSLGNDCLVPVESAMWGEHLGIVDNCDHWDLRGSSGLRTAAQSAVHGQLNERDLEEREKHREKLRKVYQSISDYRTQASSPDEDAGPPSSGIARWITERIPFADQQARKKPIDNSEGSKRLETANQEKPLSFTTSKTPKPGTFNIEALYIALARKLYEEGL